MTVDIDTRVMAQLRSRGYLWSGTAEEVASGLTGSGPQATSTTSPEAVAQVLERFRSQNLVARIDPGTGANTTRKPKWRLL